MTCDDVRSALSNADGGSLAAEGEEHLRSCAACRSWALALERLPERLASFEAAALGPGFEQRVLGRLRKPLAKWALVAAEFLIFALGMLAGYGAMRMVSDPASVAADPEAIEPVEIVLRD